MQSAAGLAFTILAVAFALAAASFAYFGIQLVYLALTFEGEGSLGHVGMYIAAVLFPSLALVCAALSFLAWRSARRRGAAR